MKKKFNKIIKKKGGEYYRVKVCNLIRDLPLFEVAPGVKIAIFNILGDTELVTKSALALSKKIPPQAQTIVTPEVKSIPLAHELSRRLKIPYIVTRKIKKPYMQNCINYQVVSITTGAPQILWVDGKDRLALEGKKVILVDDVVSTGSTLKGLRNLMKKAKADVIAEVAIFTEGDSKKWNNIISLGNLPVFSSKTPEER